MHTALDTSGFLGANLTERMLADTDLVLLDVKSGDPDTYRRVTGGELAPTLAFGRRLARAGLAGGHAPEVWIRFVLATRPPSAELTERVRNQFREHGLTTY